VNHDILTLDCTAVRRLAFISIIIYMGFVCFVRIDI
jgi:hypothetical protein